MPGYVTLVYTAKGSPSHLSQAFVLKGRRYATGEEVEVPAELAGLIVDCAPSGSVKVVTGEPVRAPRRNATAKEAARHMEAHREVFPTDPARALDSVPSLPPEVMDALAQKRGAVRFISDGNADSCLSDLAVFLKMQGRHQLARAAARRAEVLAQG